MAESGSCQRQALELAESLSHRIGYGLLELGSVEDERSEFGIVPVEVVRHRILEFEPPDLAFRRKDSAIKRSTVDHPAGTAEQNRSA